MRKQFFFITLIASMASSIAHGSMLQKLNPITSAALKRVKINTLLTRNTSTAAGKSEYDPYQDFSRGPRFIAKNAAKGIAGAAVGGATFYYTLYGFSEAFRKDSFGHTIIGLSGAAAGSVVCGGPVGMSAFAASVAVVGCAKSAKIKFDEYRAAQAEQTK